MKEPRGKAITKRSNPESCAGGGNIAGEALTGAHAGQPLISESFLRRAANDRSDVMRSHPRPFSASTASRAWMARRVLILLAAGG